MLLVILLIVDQRIDNGHVRLRMDLVDNLLIDLLVLVYKRNQLTFFCLIPGLDKTSERWITHASHRLGKADLSPPKELETLTLLTLLQALHCKCNSVAREVS